jgi:hypothetical protein
MTTNIGRIVLALALGAVLLPRDAAAQLDPLLFLKKVQPNVLIAVDTANRMQRDTDNNYRDNAIYKYQGLGYEKNSLKADQLGTAYYRRKYINLVNTDVGNGGDKFVADGITVVGQTSNQAGTYEFDAATRINVAKAGIIEAITRNLSVARFGLARTRQTDAKYVGELNEGPVKIDSLPESDTSTSTKWLITRPTVGNSSNGSTATSGVLYGADESANQKILDTLKLSTGVAGSLIPAGNDKSGVADAPVDLMLDDLLKEAQDEIIADCRTTIAVLIVGGDRGGTSSGDIEAKAKQFLSVEGQRVPIYVVLISTVATTNTERDNLRKVATASGGQFFEVTPADVASVAVGKPVPKLVQAINAAVANGFVDQGTLNKAPDTVHPFGYSSEHQVTSPILGTVNLAGANDINGAPLDGEEPVTKDGVTIPQRSNVMITTGFSLLAAADTPGQPTQPSFAGSMRAFRVYKAEKNDAKPSGYQFASDGTRLWVAGTPAAPSRNIYTATPDGQVVAFTAANAAILQPYLRTSTVALTETLIDFIRSQPLGAIVDSTPAFMDPPSVDPPPDADYPAFAVANKDRRSIIWVGANDGMLHAIDGRLGKEVWAFIPFNLLPKLEALRSGQAVGDFNYFVDGSPKIADVKVAGAWRTYLVMGEGPGGSFYQTFDVTLEKIGAAVNTSSDSLSDVLAYFATPTSVPLKWAFPRYQSFDWTCGSGNPDCTKAPWGDLSASATTVEKTVGQTWSDPAVGQIESSGGRFTVLTGSGFFRWDQQQQANRGGIVAGTSLYLLDVANGDVLDYRDVGSDKAAEDVDDCTKGLKGCSQLKNALQADVVATGPADSRFITQAYVGDLDGRIWRFDVGLDGSKVPKIKQTVNLVEMSKIMGGSSATHPVFSSMATVNVGGSQQYLFVGTGSDLLPSTGVNVQYGLAVILDQGTTGSKAGLILLEKTDGVGGDEKVSAFPAVAGDIVFFSTTTYQNTLLCDLPTANLYAFTFIGGAAYDTNSDGRITKDDSPKIRSTTGARATAPFIVDQHLVFATGNKIEMFGDPTDFNNGVGQVGVRILSWREVR